MAMDLLLLDDQEVEVENATEEIQPENYLNATSVSAFDMILKSMYKIILFLSDFLLDYVQETHQRIIIEDETVLPQDMLRNTLLDILNLTQPLEANGVLFMFLDIVDSIPRWRWPFLLQEEAKTKICNRCKMDIAYTGEDAYANTIPASSLREFKSEFKDLTFETLLKAVRVSSTMEICATEGCGKRNYIDYMIKNLPSAFTMALEWEDNETEEEIVDTASVLATEIDISAFYRYEGDRPFTKYRLVSMVWSHGDVFNCLAYEKNRWVRHSSSEIVEDIGDSWVDVLSIIGNLHVRPEFMFYENAMQRDKMVSALASENY